LDSTRTPCDRSERFETLGPVRRFDRIEMLGAESRGATIPEGLVRAIKTAALAEVVGRWYRRRLCGLKFVDGRDETRRSEPVGAAAVAAAAGQLECRIIPEMPSNAPIRI